MRRGNSSVLSKAKKMTYSLKSMSDYKCKILENRFDGTLLSINNYDVWTKLIGEFNAYNLLAVDGDSCSVNYLYPMLEGQVSVLSCGSMPPDVACDVLERLFESNVYREDVDTFML